VKQQNEDLTKQLDQSTQAISTLQQDLARLEEHAGIASTRAEELSEALEVARQELLDQQHRSDDELREEQERARSRELELIATCTEKDDRLEELQETLRQLELRNEHLQEVVETSSHDRATSAETTTALRQEITEVRELLEANKMLCCQKEEEVKRLMAGNKDLQLELEDVQNRVRRPYFPLDNLCLFSSATSAGPLVTNCKINRWRIKLGRLNSFTRHCKKQKIRPRLI
jgi:DNA repair exonuclease SbcCD ATPase subunit